MSFAAAGDGAGEIGRVRDAEGVVDVEAGEGWSGAADVEDEDAAVGGTGEQDVWLAGVPGEGVDGA